MKVFIKIYNCHSYIFDITRHYRIIDLKNKIEKTIGMNKFMQKLVFDSIELENNKLVNNYNIREDSIIYLFLIINNKYYEKNYSEYYSQYLT